MKELTKMDPSEIWTRLEINTISPNDQECDKIRQRIASHLDEARKRYVRDKSQHATPLAVRLHNRLGKILEECQLPMGYAMVTVLREGRWRTLVYPAYLGEAKAREVTDFPKGR